MNTSPHYRPVLVVDVAGFGSRRNPAQVAVRRVLRSVLGGALESAGIRQGDCHVEDRGDGALVVLPAGSSPAPLLDTFPTTLAGLLAEHNAGAPADEQVTLRVAVHAGHIHRDEHGFAGKAVNLPFRLVEAAALRRVLRRSGRPLALCVSDDLYRGVVRDEALTPDAYQPVRIRNKETRTVGWVQVPGRRPPLPGGRSVVAPVAVIAALVVAVAGGVTVVTMTGRGDGDAASSADPATASGPGGQSPTRSGAAASSLPPLSFEPWTTTQLAVAHSGKCVFADSSARVVQRRCPAAGSRQWVVERAGNAGTADPIVRFVVHPAGGCLTAPEPGPAAGAVGVVVRDCASPPTFDQVWRFHVTARTNGWTYGRVTNQKAEAAGRLTGDCLDVNGGHTGDGAVLVTWGCNEALNQLFRVVD